MNNTGYFSITTNEWLKVMPKNTIEVDGIKYVNVRTKYAKEEIVDIVLTKDKDMKQQVKIYLKNSVIIYEPVPIVEDNNYFVLEEAQNKTPLPTETSIEGERYLSIRSIFSKEDVVDFVFSKDDYGNPLASIYYITCIP